MHFNFAIWCWIFPKKSICLRPEILTLFLQKRNNRLTSSYGISLCGSSSSDSSILAFNSSGNSNPTRLAVRRILSSCSIPTEGLYRSNKVLYVRWLRRNSKTSFPSAIRRSGLDCFVVNTSRRWLWKILLRGIFNVRCGAGWDLNSLSAGFQINEFEGLPVTWALCEGLCREL